MATPRDLDPKFKAEKAETIEEKKSETETPMAEYERTKDNDDRPMIIHRQQVMDPATGVVGEKVHGPMPVEDWPAYEKEHNL